VTTPVLAENVKGKGRHYRHPASGVLVPSVTNVIGVLNKPALPRWAAKVVAEQAVAMRDSLPNLDPAEAVDLLKGAPWRSSGRAANRGTTIHAYLEARLLGLDPEVLEGEALKYRKAAEAWLDEWKPEVLATELTVFDQAYAGTGDLWCKVGDEVRIVDFKTSKAIYPEAALQLAALWGCRDTADGYAPHYWEVSTDVSCWAVRIGERSFSSKQVEDVEGTLATFRAMLEVWEWQQQDPFVEEA
jgi:hypothetical protein